MILHIDMDAFFASVEQRDNPELKGKCVLVGRDSDRGVVAAASYEARKFGVHSAMPVFQARKLCPQAVFISPRKGRYAEVSREIMSLLSEFSPLVEAVSIDEAYMDISGCERLYGPPVETAQRIKKRIFEATGLTCSVGIAPIKFLAKIASDMNKPDGLFSVMPEEMPAFIAGLPVGKVPGVGPRTRKVLETLSIGTLGDVRKYSESLLEDRLGKFGRRLAALAAGIDPSKVTSHSPTKSISSEQTLSRNIGDKTLLARVLKRQAGEVGRQLRKENLRARTVTLKLKESDFRQATRSITLPSPTQSSETIYRSAAALLDAWRLQKQIRLIGVGASGLIPASTPVQQQLFDGPEHKNATWEKVDRAMDAITARYGNGSIRKGDSK
jgi:DNA polymerase-4